MSKLPYRVEVIYPSDPVRPSRINPNVMDRGRRELLAEVVGEFGPLQFPLYQDDPDLEGGYVILDGHHRDAAFRAAELEEWHAVVLPDTARAVDVDRVRLAMNHLRGSPEHNATALLLREIQAAEPGVDLTLAGLLPAEVEMLLREAPPEIDLGAAIPSPSEPLDEGDVAAPTFELTLSFATAAEKKAARKILKKAAGKSGDLTAGFRKLAGMETTP